MVTRKRDTMPSSPVKAPAYANPYQIGPQTYSVSFSEKGARPVTLEPVKTPAKPPKSEKKD